MYVRYDHKHINPIYIHDTMTTVSLSVHYNFCMNTKNRENFKLLQYIDDNNFYGLANNTMSESIYCHLQTKKYS